MHQQRNLESAAEGIVGSKTFIGNRARRKRNHAGENACRMVVALTSSVRRVAWASGIFHGSNLFSEDLDFSIFDKKRTSNPNRMVSPCTYASRSPGGNPSVGGSVRCMSSTRLTHMNDKLTHFDAGVFAVKNWVSIVHGYRFPRGVIQRIHRKKMKIPEEINFVP